jgi:hypothetical protein
MIRRVTGTGTAATMMLALLVLACVFVTVAGPGENLAVHTQALRKTVAATSPLATSAVATADWGQFTTALTGSSAAAPQNVLVTAPQIREVTSQLRGDLSADGIPLAPVAADWAAMTSVTEPVTSGAAEDPAHLDGLPANLEVTYRGPFGRYTSLIAGRYPGPSTGTTLQVAVTEQTAARLGLHAGTRIAIGSRAQPVTLEVTGIVRQRLPRSSFWTADAAVAAPDLVYRNLAPVYWVVGVFAGPAELGQLQQFLGGAGLTLEWQFPIALGGVRGDQARAWTPS